MRLPTRPLLAGSSAVGPYRRLRAVVSSALGLVAAALVLALGAEPAHAALTAVTVLVVGTVTGDLGHDEHLPDLPPEQRVGSRREVSDLSWMLTTRSGRVSAGFHRRLREAARSRLALHGVDLDDPAHAAAVEARLGARAAATLDAPQDTLPAEEDVTRCLDALEALGTEPTRRTAP